MRDLVCQSKFRQAGTKLAREANDQDKIIHIELGGGMLLPIDRAKALVDYLDEHRPYYVGPTRQQVAIIGTHFHSIVREVLPKHKVVFIFRHRQMVGAWVASGLDSGRILRELHPDWARANNV